MARLILLDSSPLGLIVRAPSPSKPQVGQCLVWVQAMFASGAAVVIPEITHYEVRRELLRIRAVGSLRRLDFALDRRSGFRHLALSTDAIIKAAEYWAAVRHVGVPTASPDALDADAILAGQAALAGQPGDTVTIATTNLTHLSRFPGIDAQAWDQIQ
jgi:predicted nucleic acid-binding protein